MSTLAGEIVPEASSATRAAIARVQRPEDVKFSPRNRRLVLPSYVSDSVATVDVEIMIDGDGPRVVLGDVVESGSVGLRHPHGVDFLDEDTIIVANRDGGLVVLRLPSGESGAGHARVPTPIEARPGRGFAPLTRPGSLAVTRGADGVEVLVCDNAAHTLTRHLLHQEPDGFAVTANDVVVRKWLAVPDGVAVSPDGRWLAVSNHRRHVVMVYERTRVVDERSDPSCILRGALFPHGVRFSADGRYLFVADAGSPYVHAYARDGDGWQGVAFPVASLRVMGDETFRQGRYSPDEGGPKGIDIDASGEVVAVSSRFRPLAFFGIAALLERTDRSGPDHAARLACELGLLEEAGARDRAQQQRFAWFTRSGVGRATRPLRRRLYARWPGLRPRRG